MRRLACVVALLVALASGAHAEADPVLLRAVRGLAAREANLTYLSGIVLQHDMRAPLDVEQERVRNERSAKPTQKSVPQATIRTTPVSEDGLWVTRFAVGPGRCRFETVVFGPGEDPWGASIFLTDSDGKVLVQRGARPTVITTDDGTRRTEYHSAHASALVTMQTEWPTATQRRPLNRIMMLSSPLESHSWSQFIALEMGLAGQSVPGIIDPDPSFAARVRPTFRGLTRLPDAAIGGNACIGIEYRGGEERERIWLAEQFGWAVVRYEAHYPERKAPGRMHSEIWECSMFKELEPGLWLPQQSVSSTTEADQGHAPVLLRSVLSRCKELSTKPIDAAEFQARLPLGTCVQEPAVKPYWVGEVRKDNIDEALLKDRRLWDDPAEPLTLQREGE